MESQITIDEKYCMDVSVLICENFFILLRKNCDIHRKNGIVMDML